MIKGHLKLKSKKRFIGIVSALMVAVSLLSFYLYMASADPLQIWSYSTSDDVAPMVYGDMRGDGSLVVAYIDMLGNVNCLDAATGTPITKGTGNFSVGSVGSNEARNLVMGQVDGIGGLELIVPTKGTSPGVRIYRINGADLQEYQSINTSNNAFLVEFGDMDSDNVPEIIVAMGSAGTEAASTINQLEFFELDGTKNTGMTLNFGTGYYFLSMVYAENDAANTRNNFVLGLGGRDYGIRVLKEAQDASSSPQVTDVTGENSLRYWNAGKGYISGSTYKDFVFGSKSATDNWCYVIRGDTGAVHIGYSDQGSNLQTINDMAVGEVTGDGVDDILLATGGGDNRVHLLSGATSGTSVAALAKSYADTGGTTMRAVEVGEVDGNSTTRDFVSVATGGNVYLWRYVSGTGIVSTPDSAAIWAGGANFINYWHNAMLIKTNNNDNVKDLVVGGASSNTMRAITLDRTPPVITLSPSPGNVSNTANSSFNVSLDESVYLSITIYSDSGRTSVVKDLVTSQRVDWNGSGWTYTASWDGKNNSGNNVSDGTYYYTVKAVDNDNNVLQGETSTNRSYSYGSLNVDKTNPAAVLTSPADGSTVKGTVTIAGSATDTNFSQYTLHYDDLNQPGDNWVAIGTNPYNTPVSNGTLASWDTTNPLLNTDVKIRLVVTDTFGNSTTTYLNTLHVVNDVTAPTITLSYYKNYDSGTGTFSNELPLSGGVPITVKQKVYIKISANEALNANPTVNISGTANNNVTNGATSAVSGQSNTYVYAWNIANDEPSTVTASVSISAQDQVGNSAGAPNNSSVKVDTNILTPNPSATGGESKITLSWTNNEADHIQYQIWRSTSSPVDSSGAPNFTINGPRNNWDDTTVLANQTYYYKIKAKDEAGNLSPASSEVSAQAFDTISPAITLSYYKSYDSGTGTFSNSLPLSGGTPLTRQQTVYIKVYANEALNGNPVIDITGTINNNIANGSTAPVSGQVNTYVYTWSVANSEPSTATANVNVTTQDLAGNSANTINNNSVLVDTNVLTPVLSATSGYEKITLSWTNSEADHGSYRIWRSTSSSVDTSGSPNFTIAGPASSWEDTDLTLDQTYYYKIKAVDTAGNVSSDSIEVSGVAGEIPAANPYLRYYNNGAYVSIHVYWDDRGGPGSIQWSNNVLPSGAELDWQSMTVSDAATEKAYAILSNSERYKNYFFKIVKSGKISTIRAFPVDFDSSSGPRYQNDYAHGNYQPGTAMCAACHVTHSGLKVRLLTQSTYYDLCLFCHGTAATQSKYDVQSGKVKTADGWKYSLAGPIGTDYGVSKHNVDDRSTVDTTVYGSAPGKILTFTCLSCHKAHGGANDNYRLLRDTIYPSNDKFTSTTVSYVAYAIVRDQTVGEEVYMVSGNTEFCTACHLDYDDGHAKAKGGTYQSFYRHPVTVGNRVYSVYRSTPLRDWYPNPADKLPLQANPSGESIGQDKRTAVVCSTCHFAHGSYRLFNMGYPNANGLDRTYVANQKMLRLDNYGVCESCHKK